MTAGPLRRHIVIIGSGFAGSILARAINAHGKEVTLLERGSHPRFSLGESSTPLASICLERLAAEYDLPDLLALATFGRWERELPEVSHGLKRGFSFYGHRANREYTNGPGNEARLLVAASPDRGIADSHWLRAEVDHHLVRRARAEGVEVIEECGVEGAERTAEGWRLHVNGTAGSVIDADFVVDAAGGGNLLDSGPGQVSSRLSTGLLFGHFSGVGSFSEAASGASLLGAPYPEEHAAVHHLIDEGWMYVLKIGDVTSAGFVLDHAHPRGRRLLETTPADAWQSLMNTYPTLGRQFASADPLRPLATFDRLQRRSRAAAGPDWASLPHGYSFSSPMFSTGIAWSLVGVERLACALTGDPSRRQRRLQEYARLLEAEADHIEALVAPAYQLRSDFPAFAAWTYGYFAAASYHESWQRLCDPPQGGLWRSIGFLGACDPILRISLASLSKRLLRGAGGASASVEGEAELEDEVARCIAPRNLAGLSVRRRHHLYPVDLEALVASSELLGMSEPQIRDRLPRLRGSELVEPKGTPSRP